MQIQTVRVTLPIELVKKMDGVLERKQESRDELISDALHFYFTKRKESGKTFSIGGR